MSNWNRNYTCNQSYNTAVQITTESSNLIFGQFRKWNEWSGGVNWWTIISGRNQLLLLWILKSMKKKKKKNLIVNRFLWISGNYLQNNELPRLCWFVDFKCTQHSVQFRYTGVYGELPISSLRITNIHFHSLINRYKGNTTWLLPGSIDNHACWNHLNRIQNGAINELSKTCKIVTANLIT